MKRKILYILCLVCACMHNIYGQEHFFTESADDSLTTDFYKRSIRISITANCMIKTYDAGISLTLHNGHDKLSYYMQYLTNTKQSYIVKGNEIAGEQIMEKQIPYSSHLLQIGIAKAVTRNWLIFAAQGFQFQQSAYTPVAYDDFYYSIQKQGMKYAISFGAIYVADNKITASVGIDTFNKLLHLGVGYSL